MKPNYIASLLLALVLALLPATDGLARAAPPQQDSTECHNLLHQGVALSNQSHYAEALEQYQAALACYQAAGDRAGEGRILGSIGIVYAAQGRYAEAVDTFQRALAIHRQVGDRVGEGVVLNNIGIAYSNQGRYAEALEALQQALTIYREVSYRAGEGGTLNNIGDVHSDQGRYAEALAAYEQALTIERELDDRAGEGKTLDHIGEVYHRQGRYAEALDAHEQALAIFRELDDRVGEGGALGNIGNVYNNQGRYAEAVAAYEQSLAIKREVGDRAGEGKTLNNLGAAYANQQRYAEAQDAYQQALTIFRELDHRAGESAALGNIGNVYKDQGRYAEALNYYEQSLTIKRELGDRAGEGHTLNNIGTVYANQGRYAEALEALQQALAIYREVGNRAGEGDALNNVGSIHNNQGRYAEALSAHQQALAVFREVGDRAGEGAAVTNIGYVYDSQGRSAEALEYFQEALAVFREVGDRAGEGATLTGIGNVYADQGRYAEALDAYQQALTINRELGDRAGEGVVLNNIGNIHEDQGRYDEALDAYEQALDISHEIGDRAGEGRTLTGIGIIYANQGRYTEALAAFQQALAIWRELDDRVGEGATLGNIGQVYAAQGQVDQALDAYQEAMDIIEAVRATAGSEEGRAAFIAQYAGLYGRAAGLFHQQGQVEEAFLTAERGRARAFLDSLATGQVQLGDNEASDLLAQEQALYAQRQALQDNLAQSRAQTQPDTDLIADLESQLAEVKAAYADVQAQIEARNDQLADMIPGRSQNVLGVSDAQALLDEQTALLSFYTLEEQSLVFVLTPDHFEVIELEATREQLANQVTRFRDLIGFRQPEDTRQAAQELYRTLIAPLAQSQTFEVLETSKVSRLLIVPHGPLHYLPFAALLDPDSGKYLLERYQVVILPSASALPFIQANAGGALTNPLILGNPTPQDDSLPSLKFAEQEAQTIAGLFKTKPLLGQAATESGLWEQVSQAGILHVAAHGSYNAANPLYSTLALTPDDENDGRLEVWEVYGLDLANTELVVLSACQTQLGELSAGDEVVGLSRAFFFAGTPTVIATLWNVDDAATGLLMERFYTHLQAGVGKAEALRQAQLEVLGNYPDPYYWAAFVMSGDGGAVEDIRNPDEGRIGEVTAQGTETEQSKIVNLKSKIGWVLLGGGGLVCLLAFAMFIGGGVWWLLRPQRLG